MQEETQRNTPGVTLDTKYSTVSGLDEKWHLIANHGLSRKTNRLLAAGRCTKKKKTEEKTKDSVQQEGDNKDHGICVPTGHRSREDVSTQASYNQQFSAPTL